jgi:hypothetical protein
VNQENTVTLEPNNYILATAFERSDPLALELGGDGEGIVRPGQTAVEDLDAIEPPSDEQRFELGANSLDLG